MDIMIFLESCCNVSEWPIEKYGSKWDEKASMSTVI
jgi:hypothetical protein